MRIHEISGSKFVIQFSFEKVRVKQPVRRGQRWLINFGMALIKKRV